MSIVCVEEVGSANIGRLNKLLVGIPGGVYKAAYSALKRAGETAKTKAGQFAAGEYAILKGDFMKNVTVKTDLSSASGSVIALNIIYAGNVLPLLTFNTRHSRDGLLTTQVKRCSGAAVLQHAFAERIFGPTAVFERIGTSRFPVEQKFGPSTAHMMGNDQVVTRMDETIRETYEKRIEHEIMRVLNGWG